MICRCIRALAIALTLTAALTTASLPSKTAAAQNNQTSFKFDFGPGQVAPGYTQVLPAMTYTKERGYGFEPAATITGGVLFKEGDGTHHSNYGSYELAKCIVAGIKTNRLGLMKFLAQDVSAFDPRRPDPVESFKVPASPLSTDVKPLGN